MDEADAVIPRSLVSHFERLYGFTGTETRKDHQRRCRAHRTALVVTALALRRAGHVGPLGFVFEPLIPADGEGHACD